MSAHDAPASNGEGGRQIAEYVVVSKADLLGFIEAVDDSCSYDSTIWRKRCRLLMAATSPLNPALNDGPEEA